MQSADVHIMNDAQNVLTRADGKSDLYRRIRGKREDDIWKGVNNLGRERRKLKGCRSKGVGGQTNRLIHMLDTTASSAGSVLLRFTQVTIVLLLLCDNTDKRRNTALRYFKRKLSSRLPYLQRNL